MKFKLPLIFILSVCLSIPLAIAATNQGSKQIDLHGGTRGKVPFPHQRHQTAIGDCKVCHHIFPQTPGAIEALQSQGQLKPKQVMNKMCINCHRAEKKAGKPSGPTTCNQCHVR